MGRMKGAINGDQNVPWKCDRLIYGDDGDFAVSAIRLASSVHPTEWNMPLAYPTAGVSKGGVKKRALWTSELLMDALQDTLRKIRGVYGGDWVLDIRRVRAAPTSEDRVAGVRTKAEKLILDGPDTPGRRWLLKNRGKPASLAPILKSVPKPAPPVRAASATMIDRLKKPAVTLPSKPLQADEDWFNAESERLRAEEPPVVHEEIPF